MSFDPLNRVLYQRGEGDSFVVPHCLPLLQKFHSHINMEVAGTGQLFQCLFKYIHKGIFEHFYEHSRTNMPQLQVPIMQNFESKLKTTVVTTAVATGAQLTRSRNIGAAGIWLQLRVPGVSSDTVSRRRLPQ